MTKEFSQDLFVKKGSKVYIKGLFPCDCRKINVQKYYDFFNYNGYSLTSSIKNSDVVVLWTCGFRDDYRKNSVNLIYQILELVNIPVIICGCLPHIDPDLLQQLESHKQCVVVPWRDEMKFFSQFIYSDHKPYSSIKPKYVEKKLVEDLASYRKENKKPDRTFSDQFVKLFISEGCSLNCSYCSEKRTFPDYHSYPFHDLINSCSDLIETYNEYHIMLIADNVGEYGLDINYTLPDLILALFELDDKVKVGIQNLNPTYFKRYFDSFTNFIKNDRMLHLRLPIQSASDKILKTMNRTYSKSDLHEIFSFMVKVGFNDFSTDMICGFPGESENDYQETLKFLLNYVPTYVNLSAFMSSSSIPAGLYDDQIPEKEKRIRVFEAEKLLKEQGVYCNTDFGLTSDHRRSIINTL